ncbi:sigma-54-dependent transcriptional regulator [Haloferula chungangensis]|uniref:Sigma-54-dependent transcriptional regulator n=1 Tax=Haloferula chungangensis TaxID=1048331 RepID=A0ABW2L9M2_9BACT
MPASLLIVEDHHALAVAIAAGAERCGLTTSFAPTLARARELLRSHEFTGILLDIGLPDGHGLELIEGWDFPHKPEIAVVTAHGEIENAIAARKLGIARFFDKPVDFEELQSFFQSLTISTGPEVSPRPDENRASTFVGASPAMRPVFRQIAHACASDQAVVIRGAAGTGKSHVARIIQQSSSSLPPRPILHASALLDESELANAVTEARESALIIESISALSSQLQALLARTLDQLGKQAPRLIVTTGEEGLLKQVADGRFDQDLYYRLQILEVSLPPLKERLDDLPALSACFLGELDASISTRLDESVLDTFTQYDWPGNLRELHNVINYAIITSGGAPLITRQFIPEHLAGIPRHHAKDGALSHALEFWVDRKLEEPLSYKDISADLEGLLLRILLRRFEGKQSHLAAALSINRSTLRKKLRNDEPPVG